MKTPITYYGGKQKLASVILPLIPPHNLYCEPFIGGGAIFFAKPPSPVEVINDTNKELINFYRIAQTQFVPLQKEIQTTLHSRDLFRKASVIYNNPDMFSEIKRAWALWTLAAQGFASILDTSWGYDIKKGTTSIKVHNKREAFTKSLAYRLEHVQIECTDALRIIESRDSKDSFFYCDPPYFNSDMGHYDGYTKEDFERLLQILSRIQGKFLLSSYPSDLLSDYTSRNGWHQIHLKKNMDVNSKGKRVMQKIEVVTWNY